MYSTNVDGMLALEAERRVGERERDDAEREQEHPQLGAGACGCRPPAAGCRAPGRHRHAAHAAVGTCVDLGPGQPACCSAWRRSLGVVERRPPVPARLSGGSADAGMPNAAGGGHIAGSAERGCGPGLGDAGRRLLRFLAWRQLGAGTCVLRAFQVASAATAAGSRSTPRLELVDQLARLVQAALRDRSGHRRLVARRGTWASGIVGPLVEAGQADAGERLVDAAEDGDVAVLVVPT